MFSDTSGMVLPSSHLQILNVDVFISVARKYFGGLGFQGFSTGLGPIFMHF